jgi:hypothetical protein
MEFMISMVRAAVLQDTIREQTQIVEERKYSSPQYVDDALNLAVQEDELRKSLGGLLQKIVFDGVSHALTDPLAGATGSPPSKFADFQPVIEATLGLAGEVSGDLRTPKTDEGVVGAEGTIIELLVPPDKKSGQSSSKAQQMMQKMMAQATQAPRAGGNNSKSSSSFPGDETTGLVSKGKAETRPVDKTGGANTGEWPEEFRDQLQAYFQQIEGGSK